MSVIRSISHTAISNKTQALFGENTGLGVHTDMDIHMLLLKEMPSQLSLSLSQMNVQIELHCSEEGGPPAYSAEGPRHFRIRV